MRRLPFLASFSAALAGVAFVRSGARAASAVIVLYAGSLVTIMENVVRPAVAKDGLDFKGEAKGSVALANLIKSGLRSPDVFISADLKVLDDLMTAQSKNVVQWYAPFATTRLVIGYAAHSPFASDFADVAKGTKKLVDVLLSPGLKLGRTDPAVDPKGYRTIIAAKLLESGGDAPADFATKLLGDDRNPAQIFPEETLLARLETGDLDAAFLYATESVARKVPSVELPDSANLGDPAQAAHYATASVTIDGTKHTGSPSVYGITIPTVAPDKVAAESFVTYLLGTDGQKLLESAGVTVVKPAIVGDRGAVPPGVLAQIA
jgi:molybdate/tungstate transport system substrate-binding protein